MSAAEFNDRFERTFFSRIPADVAQSFSDEQLTAIKTVFGGEVWNSHPVDLRGTLRLPFRRWYFVVLAGPDKRTAKSQRVPTRARRPIRRALGAATTTIAVIWMTLLVLYILLPPDMLPRF